jgi:cell division protein FtsB
MCKTHQANIRHLTTRVDALKVQLTGTKSQFRPGSLLADTQSLRYRSLAQEVQNGRKEIDKLREEVIVSKRQVKKLQKENAELTESASASTDRKLHEQVIQLQARLREFQRGEGDSESPKGLQDQLLEAQSQHSAMAFTLYNERLSNFEKDKEVEELKVKLLETTGRLEALSEEKREAEAALENLREQARLCEEEIENSLRCKNEAGCEDKMEHLTQPLEPLQSNHIEEPASSKQQVQAEQHRRSQDKEVAVVLGELRIQAVRLNEDEEKRRELALVEAHRLRLAQERSDFYLERASAKKSLEAWESQLSALSQRMREGLAAVPQMPRSSESLPMVSGHNPVVSAVACFPVTRTVTYGIIS